MSAEFDTRMARLLTAVESTREVDGIVTLVVAVSDSAADTGRVAPHHLREVAPGIFEMGIVVGILGLFLVPAVGGGTGELDPSIVVEGSGRDRRQIAARTFLTISVTA
jgi:hypothetical protein